MGTRGILFVLESFRRHMDNGRWLCQLGFESNGYLSVGNNVPPPGINSTNVRKIVDIYRPDTVIFWPRYEWARDEWGDQPGVTDADRFTEWECLLSRPDILRVAVLHDAASAIGSQHRWHREFKPHVYLTCYHQKSVIDYNPHINTGQIVRTYHVLDDCSFPIKKRDLPCVIAGARNRDVYPLRTRAMDLAKAGKIKADTIPHPGYAQTGSLSNDFLKTLAKYRVAICTASRYGFALRKIIEATAAGCRVITDLPAYDCLPGIDDNLIRVKPYITDDELQAIIEREAEAWDTDRQRDFAHKAREIYHYRRECARVAELLDERRDDL
jgi:hypothetical protein